MQDKKKISNKIIYFLNEYSVLLGLAVLIIVASIMNPAFLSGRNFLNILRQVSTLGLVSLGMTFVVISGGVDLSVGSTMSVAGVTAVCLLPVIGIVPSIIISVLFATGLGWLNGLMVTITGGAMGNSVIISFAMQTALAALALTITNGAVVHADAYPAYSFLGKGSVGIVPISTLVFLAGVAIVQFLLRKTKFGRINYCLGINDVAARLSGLSVRFYRTIVYALAGLFSGLGAIFLTARVSSASPLQGVGYETDAIAAVILGGVRMGGGAGDGLKALLGVMVFGVMTNALNILGVSAYPQLLVKGVIIVLSIILDKNRVKVENRKLAEQI